LAYEERKEGKIGIKSHPESGGQKDIFKEKR